MRILILSNAYKPTLSGVVTSITIFKRALTAAGHEVFVFAPNYWGYRDSEEGIQRFPAVDFTRFIDFSYPLPLRKRIVENARGLQPDIIHCQHPAVMGDRAADVARKLHIPLVATFHCRYDVYARYLAPALKTLVSDITRRDTARFARQCDAIILPGENMREWLNSTFSIKAPVAVVPTPIDLELYRDLPRDAFEKPLGIKKEQVLLFVGRLSGEKHIDLLVRAMPYVLAKRPEMKLILVGKGTERGRLVRLIQRLGLQKSVFIYGPRPLEEIPALLGSASLFLFASEIETQALGLIEALAAGVPAVAVDSPATRDALAAGGGVLARPEPEAYGNAVLDMLESPGKLQALGRQAQAAAQAYAIPLTVNKLVSVYQQAIREYKNPAQ
jgi:1,2-diacylglycerol 3-alpha-glucosyltransferase